MRAALVLAALLLAAPAQAKPWECVLWPKSCQAPVSSPLPVPEPPAALPAPIQVAPPVAPVKHAKPHPKAKPHPRIKSKFAKPKRKAVDNSGPDLPWPCWMVRLRAGGRSNAELAAEGRSQGIKLTAKQERQALACLGRA